VEIPNGSRTENGLTRVAARSRSETLLNHHIF